MKKTIALAIALIMTLTLAACSGGNGGTPNNKPDGSNNTQNPPQSTQDDSETAAPNLAPSTAADTQITLVNDTGNPFHLGALILEGEGYISPVGYDVIENGDSMAVDLSKLTTHSGAVDQFIAYFMDGENKHIRLNQYTITAGSTITINKDFSCTIELPDGSVTTTAAGKVDFSIARGFDEQEVIFRLNVPLLQERVDYQGFTLKVWLSDSFVIDIGGIPPSPFRVYTLNNADRYDNTGICTYEGDVITASVYLPENTIDWNSINNITVYTIEPGQDGLPEYNTFSKSDSEVPLLELLPGVDDMRRLSIENFIKNAVISAKDNGDGTITFTYRDATLTPPYRYMAPWEPPTDGWQREPQGDSVRFEVEVSAIVGLETYAARSGFRYPPYPFVYSEDPFERRFLNLMDVFSGDTFNGIYRGDGIPAAKVLTLDLVMIDENGLTVIWTEDIAHPFSIDDIIEFCVTFVYDDSGYKDTFYSPDSFLE